MSPALANFCRAYVAAISDGNRALTASSFDGLSIADMIDALELIDFLGDAYKAGLRHCADATGRATAPEAR